MAQQSLYRYGAAGGSAGHMNKFLNHRIGTKDLLAAEFILLIVVGFLSNIGVLPGATSYVFDVVNIALLFLSLRKLGAATREVRFFNIAVIALLAFDVSTAVVNFVAPQYAFWQAISFTRPFVWVYLLLIYWDRCDAVRFLNFLFHLQWANVLFVLFEYFVLGLFQDNIGGFFGTEAGCNGPLNVYLCIVCAWGLSRYLGKKMRIAPVVATMLASLLIAAVAELKFFFVEFAIIAIIVVLYSKPSWKTFLVLGAIAVIASIGLRIFAQVNPQNYQILIDPKSMLDAADNTDLSSGYGISRAHSFKQINTMFFRDDTLTNLIGFGLGSASNSSIDFFSTTFFALYGYLHYYYLSSAMLFIQTGYVGTILFLLPTVLVGLYLLFHPRKAQAFQLEGTSGFVVVLYILYVLNIIYNSTAVTYPAWLWAVPQALGLFNVAAIRKRGAEHE